jgi:hypothetical protein
MRSPVVSSKVKYKDGLGIPGRRSTLQREGITCDSGVTEGSTTKKCCAGKSYRDEAAPTSLYPTCRDLIGRIILM